VQPALRAAPTFLRAMFRLISFSSQISLLRGPQCAGRRYPKFKKRFVLNYQS
jgi:hypothetical protein